MASFNFGLLELAGGESGEAAVSVVVRKAKANAARAKKAEAAASAESAADKEKAAALKNLYFHKLQHDNAIRSIGVELKRLRQALIKLRAEEKKLKEIGKDGRHLIQLSEEKRELRLKQLSEEQRKFRQQQKKLREEEPKLKQQQKEFYLEHGFLAADREECQVGDHKPEEKVTSDDGSEAEQKPAGQAATPANVDAKPSSGSEKSSAAGTAASNNLQDGSGRGSQKRKKKNAAKKNGANEVDKAKKQDSSEADVWKKIDKEPLADYPREGEKRQNWLLNTLQSWLLPRWLC